MADQLDNLGEPVSDGTLILNLVRGLNAKYTAIGRHIRRGRPFPTFLEAKNDLLLKEITVGASDPDPSTALLAAAAGRPSAPAPQQRSGGSGGGSGPGGGSGGATSKTRRSGKRSNRQPKSGGSSSGNGGSSGGGEGGSGLQWRGRPMAVATRGSRGAHPRNHSSGKHTTATAR